VVKAGDEVLRPVVRVNLMEKGSGGLRTASFVDRLSLRPSVRPADVEPNRAWLFHDESFRFDTEHGPLDQRYETRAVPLDFAIHLHDFVEEKYPGISTAASFESHVTVHPAVGDPFEEKIYMNHPLIYSGYTFYQASFQRTPGGEEITVLSVARDPGMTISFVGYCILVAGLVLIFFVKPYFRKLDDRWAARVRMQAGGAR
jgi:cytochrome c biogenesis protein ResB